MLCVSVPQFHAETHVGDVVQVRVGKLAEEGVHALMEKGVRAFRVLRLGAQALMRRLCCAESKKWNCLPVAKLCDTRSRLLASERDTTKVPVSGAQSEQFGR
jgi:hypothetical protein